jgi:hypothetical protein
VHFIAHVAHATAHHIARINNRFGAISQPLPTMFASSL